MKRDDSMKTDQSTFGPHYDDIVTDNIGRTIQGGPKK